MTDAVNHPAHYTQGKIEAIEIIEDVVGAAPDPVSGYLVGQSIKYLLRAWHKGSPSQDLKKACWYLNRAIDTMESK